MSAGFRPASAMASSAASTAKLVRLRLPWRAMGVKPTPTMAVLLRIAESGILRSVLTEHEDVAGNAGVGLPQRDQAVIGGHLALPGPSHHLHRGLPDVAEAEQTA